MYREHETVGYRDIAEEVIKFTGKAAIWSASLAASRVAKAIGAITGEASTLMAQGEARQAYQQQEQLSNVLQFPDRRDHSSAA